MSYLPKEPDKALRSINTFIEYGMRNALSAANAMSRRQEQNEVGWDFASEGGANFQAERPWYIDAVANDPASTMFSKMGQLAPEQDAVARHILRAYGQVDVGETITVDNAFELHRLWKRTEGIHVKDLPEDLAFGLRYGHQTGSRRSGKPGGLEDVLRDIDKTLEGKSEQLPPALRAAAVEAAFPERSVPTTDPLRTKSLEDYDWGMKEEPSEFPDDDQPDFSGVKPSMQEDIARARMQAAQEGAGSPMHGPTPSLDQSATAIREWARNTVIRGGNSLSPTQRAEQDRQELLRASYERRGEWAPSIRDETFDAFQTYQEHGGTLATMTGQLRRNWLDKPLPDAWAKARI